MKRFLATQVQREGFIDVGADPTADARAPSEGSKTSDTFTVPSHTRLPSRAASTVEPVGSFSFREVAGFPTLHHN